MIIPLQFKASSGLAAELEIHDVGHDKGRAQRKLEALKGRVKLARDFYGDQLDGDIQGLANLLREGTEKLKILDIGFGTGKSTLFLADKGHEVCGLEPSQKACTILDGLAEHVGLKIKVYRGPAEALDQVRENDFDLIVFNASLHHCDEPLKILRMCRQKLKGTGRIFLNEPILKPFRTKSWYQRMLKEQPVRMGHYGGNEHIYYYWEYVLMLRAAGFRKISTRPSITLRDWRGEVKRMARHKVDGKTIYTWPRLVAHSTWKLGLATMGSMKPVRQILTAASLYPVNFVARR